MFRPSARLQPICRMPIKWMDECNVHQLDTVVLSAQKGPTFVTSLSPNQIAKQTLNQTAVIATSCLSTYVHSSTTRRRICKVRGIYHSVHSFMMTQVEPSLHQVHCNCGLALQACCNLQHHLLTQLCGQIN